MINLLNSVKNITAVAISGGPDSMAALSFLFRNNPELTAIYFHHGTSHGEEALKFIQDYCHQNQIKLLAGKIKNAKPSKESWEEFWRKERYDYLHSLKNHLIATAHHLNDVAETYLWSCLHGPPRFIHYHQPGPNGPTNIVRPFLLTPKQELLDWCHRHQIPYLQDPSNSDTSYARNQIRLKIMPEILKVNPGFLTVVKRLLSNQLEEKNGIAEK